MNLTTATAADLAVDHDFIQWVKYPTQESNAFWNGFVDQHPYKAKELADARHLVLLLSQEDASNQPYDQDAKAVWDRLQNILHLERGGGKNSGRVVSFWRPSAKAWLSVAASILAVVASALVFIELQNTNTVTYATAYGEKRTIQLPDKSVIVLNSNSNVTIPEKWHSTKPRKVELQGEAFFSVTPQVNKQQFVVTTSQGTQINVLGTAFNVYDRGQKNRVVLESGKVNLSIVQDGKAKHLEMQPGELVSITADESVAKRQVDPSLYTAWRQDKIYLDNYTLGEVAVMLAEQYGVQVEFENTALSENKITAFLEVKSPDDILYTLAETFGLRITQQDEKVYISSL